MTKELYERGIELRRELRQTTSVQRVLEISQETGMDLTLQTAKELVDLNLQAAALG